MTLFNRGDLYLVATPIGNLSDITLRAINVLSEVDVIAAEDTRHTMKLLNHLGIKKPLESYHEHNKKEKGKYLINILLEGKNVALVSDAGTPGISDPGVDMVKLAVEEGINITMVPGPVAAVMGLVLSGLATEKFVFEGFLSQNKKIRKEALLQLENETRTIVLYEAPHKLLKSLKDIYKALGNRKIALARELTKKFEEIDRMFLQEAINKYEKETPRGEFVLIIDGKSKEEIKENKEKEYRDISIEEHVNLYIETGLDKKQAMKKVAEIRGISKRDVYDTLISKK